MIPDAQSDTFWGEIPYVLPTRNFLNQRYFTTHSATPNPNCCQNFIRCRKAQASEPSLASTNLPNHLICSFFSPAVILYFRTSKPEEHQTEWLLSVFTCEENMSPKSYSFFVLFQYDGGPRFLPTYCQLHVVHHPGECLVAASWAGITLCGPSHTPSQVSLEN